MSDPFTPAPHVLGTTERTGRCLGGDIRYRLDIWSASRPAWSCLDPALERVEAQPSLRKPPSTPPPPRRVS
jgi:hypothetical protein